MTRMPGSQGEHGDEQADAWDELGATVESDRESAPGPPLPQPQEGRGDPVTLVPGPAAQDSPGWHSPTPATTGGYDVGRGTAYPSPDARPSQSINGIFSGVRRSGRWQVPPVLFLNQVFSDVALDLREAQISSPEVEVRLTGAFCDCTIVVPPGVQVDWNSGFSVFSDEKDDDAREVEASMWRLRISHQGAFNDVRVRTLAAGEEPPKWWKKLGL